MMLVLISILLLFAAPASAAPECGVVGVSRHYCVEKTGTSGVELWVVEPPSGSKLHIKVDCLTKAAEVVDATEDWSFTMIKQGAHLACKHFYLDGAKPSLM